MGEGNRKDKRRSGWLRIEKETIRMENKSRSQFFGKNIRTFVKKGTREDKKNDATELAALLVFHSPTRLALAPVSHTTYIFSTAYPRSAP